MTCERLGAKGDLAQIRIQIKSVSTTWDGLQKRMAVNTMHVCIVSKHSWLDQWMKAKTQTSHL